MLADPARFAGTAVLYGTLPFDAGVPTTPDRLQGAPVFLAHGEDDHVIPSELLAATWAYLHETSGADLQSLRGPGGHGITPAVLHALRDWVADTTAPRPAAP